MSQIIHAQRIFNKAHCGVKGDNKYPWYTAEIHRSSNLTRDDVNDGRKITCKKCLKILDKKKK